MELKHIKLRTGEDLLGHVEILNNAYRITSPVSMQFDPREGIFGKNWLLLSNENSVLLSKDDVFFCHEASDKAISYYEEFVHQYSAMPEDDQVSEIEEMLLTMLESRHSIKH